MNSRARGSCLWFVAFEAGIALLVPIPQLCGQGESKADPFDHQVQNFRLDHQTLFDAIARIHEETGVVISVEKVLTTSGTSHGDQEFTSTITGGKLDVVLNEICTVAGRYTWSRDGKMVNIYPSDVVGDESC